MVTGQRKATLLPPTWISSCQSAGTVIFALPFTTSVAITISIFQTFSSWVATSHLRPPLAFLSHNSSDTPGLVPLMNVLFWGRCDFPVNLSGKDMSGNVCNRLYGNCIVVTGVLTNNMRFPSPDCYTTFWRMTIYSDTFNWWDITPFLPFSDLDLITESDFYLIVWGSHRTFATGAAWQQRTLTPPDTCSCPTLGLTYVLMSKPISPELVLFPDFWVSNIPWYFCFA